MKAANRLKAVDDQVAGQNDLGDYHDNGLYYSQHQTAEFAYDDNGNLEQDMNRNIGIKYGILHNLPIYIAYRQTGGGGSIATLDVSSSTVDLSDRAASTSYSGSMMNYYTLQGRKMAKKVYNDQHTLTLNESYYDELMLSHRQPARISHADGYVSLDENGEASFYYYLKDHLGNVRSVITPDADGKPQVEQANDYFPFGMSFESRLPLLTKSGSGNNKLKYNGKEEQEMPGKWLDYGARLYDPALGRWHVVDPMTEKYFNWSPYNYVGSNPIKRVDPDGMDWDIVIDHDQQNITVKANFTTFAGNDETVQASADTWNAQSGKFSYVVGKNDDAITYSVNFDISVNDGTSDASAANDISVAPDDSKVFTDRARTEDGNNITIGGLSDGKSILMPESQKGSIQKTSHEMGHNLGMGHTSGLMAEQGGKNFKGSSVNETLKHSGVKGKSKRDESPNAKLRNKTEIGKAPNNFNNGKIQSNKNWEKKNFN